MDFLQSNGDDKMQCKNNEYGFTRPPLEQYSGIACSRKSEVGKNDDTEEGGSEIAVERYGTALNSGSNLIKSTTATTTAKATPNNER